MCWKSVAALEGEVAALAVAAAVRGIDYAILMLPRRAIISTSTPQLYGGTYTLFAHMLPETGIDVRLPPAIRPRIWQNSLIGAQSGVL